MEFSVTKKQTGSLARNGLLTTPNGKIRTPAFMPVGTAGAVKTLPPGTVRELGADVILGNTYHLHIRPGEKLIKKFGGLAKWNGWGGPTLTDSGGYQAYSLSRSTKGLAKITDEGVKFQSHLDGAPLFFNPENVLDIQSDIGSDIAMVLDDCPPIEASEQRVLEAVERTSAWAKRSIDHWQKKGMGEQGRALFGIIQGGLFKELREKSAKEVQDLPFDGIAVGGVAIASEGKEKINAAVEYVADMLDPLRPHYLMGVGEPVDLIKMVNKGIDMFDCVLPTRLARHGSFWTGKGYVLEHIEKNAFFDDGSPLDPDCSCQTCKTYSRSYLRHIFMAKETLALQLLTVHNLHTILLLMEQIRDSIADDSFTARFATELAS